LGSSPQTRFNSYLLHGGHPCSGAGGMGREAPRAESETAAGAAAAAAAVAAAAAAAAVDRGKETVDAAAAAAVAAAAAAAVDVEFLLLSCFVPDGQKQEATCNCNYYIHNVQVEVVLHIPGAFRAKSMLD
jgi:hypothetical protein